VRVDAFGDDAAHQLRDPRLDALVASAAADAHAREEVEQLGGRARAARELLVDLVGVGVRVRG